MKFCPKCAVKFNDGSGFCGNCGSQLIQIDVSNKSKNDNTTSSDVSTQNNPENKKSDKKTGKIIGISVVVLILIAAISAGAYFFLASDNSPFKKEETEDEEPHSKYVSLWGEHETELESETQVLESTTESLTVTDSEPQSQSVPAAVSNDKLYVTFFNFYISYLDGINALDAEMLNLCTAEVKEEMAERFQYNKRSIFDLSRIDYDIDSFTTNTGSVINEYSFYVKCVTKMYDRDTFVEKETNFAVWKVTITELNGNCVISKMERDDDYKMGINIKTINDNSSIF